MMTSFRGKDVDVAVGAYARKRHVWDMSMPLYQTDGPARGDMDGLS